MLSCIYFISIDIYIYIYKRCCSNLNRGIENNSISLEKVEIITQKVTELRELIDCRKTFSIDGLPSLVIELEDLKNQNVKV